MNGNKLRRPRRTAAAAALAVGALLATAACGGGSGGGSSSSGIPSTVKVDAILPLTGPAAFAGTAAQKGYKLAVKEINDSGYLGSGVKLDVKYEDTKGETQTAASSLSAAIADKSVAAVFGSLSSQEAVAQSPLAQKAGLPIVYTQAGSEGVVVGDYTYRATPLMSSYYPIIKQYLTDNKWKSIGIVYTNVAPTLEEVGTKTIPAVADELGIKVTKTVATTATTQDFSAPISQVLATKPDVVAILQIGASNPTAMTQLRQAGYKGPVLGNSGAGAGNLKPAGPDGAGMVWPVDFDASQAGASSQKFVTAYKAMFNEAPLNYAAEAYDAAYFLANSIKSAGSADRSKIKGGMATEAGKTTSGALGEKLTWKDGTIQVPGVVLEWTGTATKLIYAAS